MNRLKCGKQKLNGGILSMNGVNYFPGNIIISQELLLNALIWYETRE